MNLPVLLSVLLFTALTNAGVSMHNPNFCYTTDPIRSFTHMFALYTPYEAIRPFNLTTLNPTTSTCTPTRLWYAGRFGGGFPSPSNTRDMLAFASSTIQQDIINNYNAGRTTLCREDFEAIRNWTKQANFTLENAFMPSEASSVLMQNIAKRYQQAFPTLLTDTYSREHFFFRHSPSARANSSIRAFATGLFGEDGAQNVVYEDVPDTPDRDWLLSPFDSCPQFNEEVGWADPDERVAFLEGPEFEELQDQVNVKLGLTGSSRLSVRQILVMWNWCRFETSSAFVFTNSPTGGDHAWCAPFSIAHHQLLEYAEDLWAFYIYGFGVPNQRLIINLHCGLYQDLLTHLQSNSEEKVRIFVALLQQPKAILTSLGALRDVWPIHRHNYAQQFDRNWKSSLVTPFGSNIGIVRFDCEDGDHEIRFYWNERPILIPGCDQQTGVCKLDTIIRSLERFVGVDCETHFCSNN